MSSLDDQIVTLFQHFLNDALEGTVVLKHFHFAFQPSGPIGEEDLVSHSRRWAMTPWRIACLPRAWRSLVREVVNRQEQGQAGHPHPARRPWTARSRDLALLPGLITTRMFRYLTMFSSLAKRPMMATLYYYSLVPRGDEVCGSPG